MKNLLSVLILSVLLVSCEGEQGASSESSTPVNPINQGLNIENVTSDYYGVYETGCIVGGSSYSIADDVKIRVEINATEVLVTEEVYVSGGLGCMPANLIVTLDHVGQGDFKINTTTDSEGVVTVENVLELDIDDTEFIMEHIVFDDYNCGGVIIDEVGDNEYLPANGCEYSRTGDELEFNFSGNLTITQTNGMDIQGLSSSSLSFTKQ